MNAIVDRVRAVARAVRRGFRREPPPPWRVSMADGVVHARAPSGNETSAPLDGLSGVAIQTTSDGPWGSDLWWHLDIASTACTFPGEAEGADAVVERLIALPGFDHLAMTMAMGSTDDAVFPVWRRPEPGA